MDAHALVRCRDMRFSYASRPALHAFSFDAGSGEHIVLIGPNGAGKSTLLRCLSGVLPCLGLVECAGRPVGELHPKERARRIAVVPQRGEFPPHMDVGRAVLLGRYPHLSRFGNYGPADYAAAEEAMRATCCLDLALRPLGALSGGEMQRVLLARALAQQSPVLLLDELSTGLDMARMSELFDLLGARRAAGLCCISAMHDLNLAALYATRVMGIKEGRLLFDGPPQEVCTGENMRSLFDVRLYPVSHPANDAPQFCPREPGGGAKAVYAAILLTLVFFGTALSDAWAAVSRVDATGAEIRLETPARRIIPLYGAFAEILAALGMEHTIAARTEADAALPGLAALPLVGTHMRPNPELTAALQPDLVLMLQGRGETLEQAGQLCRLGLRVAVFGMNDFEELFTVVRALGAFTGAEDKAALLEEQWRARLEAVARRVEGRARPSIFFEARYPNLLAAGQISVVSEIIERAGGRNAVETKARFARLNEEELLRLDPDFYLVQRGPMNNASTAPAARAHYASLKAVREGRVFEVEERLFSRPGPASVLAVEYLAARLHPEVFP